MSDHTPAVNIRVPRQLWEAYGRCTARINGGRDRTEDLTRHMIRTVELLGSDEDKQDLAGAIEELEARRARKGGRPRKPAAVAEDQAAELADADGIVVIGCGASKQDHAAPARELYTGAYFRSCLAAATAAAPLERVFILSARYGLVPLGRVIEPYDLTIGEPGAITVDQLKDQAEALGITGQPVTALCSARYAGLVGAIWEDVTTPLAGLGIGYQRAVLGAMRDARSLLPKLPRDLDYSAEWREDD